MVGWTLVVVDVWPWAVAGPGFRAGPRGTRLTAEAAWYAVSERLGSQFATLAFSPLVRSQWWLDIRVGLDTEELFGVLLHAYRRLAVEVPEPYRWDEQAGEDRDDVLSVAPMARLQTSAAATWRWKLTSSKTTSSRLLAPARSERATSGAGASWIFWFLYLC